MPRSPEALHPILIRSLHLRLKRLYQPPAVEAASLYRRLFYRKHVIGITGSCGKTSSKDLTAAVLGATLRGAKSYDTTNNDYSIARTLFRTMPWHDFLVQEIGAFDRGGLDRPVAVLRPTIAVITIIGNDHVSSFRDGNAVLLEKRKLVDALPADGVAVLNADDSRLAALAHSLPVRVVTFGRAPEADVRASAVDATYPRRLSFDLSCNGEHLRVETRMLGEHLLPSALTALAVAHVAGVPLSRAAAALEDADPTPGRMCPIETPGGITFIDDSYKAPYWSLQSVFEFLRSAQAPRKWLVLHSVSDTKNVRNRSLYTRLTRWALESVDRAVFIGEAAVLSVASSNSVRAFATVREAHEFLAAELRAGDLVLVKGNNRTDHLIRLIAARTRKVRCWREDCRLQIDCRRCRHVGS